MTEQPVALIWQHPRAGLPEYQVTCGEIELGRIRVQGPQYWATQASGDKRPVLFVDLGQAASWLAKKADEQDVAHRM